MVEAKRLVIHFFPDQLMLQSWSKNYNFFTLYDGRYIKKFLERSLSLSWILKVAKINRKRARFGKGSSGGGSKLP